MNIKDFDYYENNGIRRVLDIEPLDIQYDRLNDIVRIDGVDYSGAFFRTFANPDPSVTYRIRKDSDGKVTITKL